MNDTGAPERARINSETSKIAWRELQRFFAQGKAINVAGHLDLIEVAYRFSADHRDPVEEWLKAGHVGPVSDAQAEDWFVGNVQVWAVVVRPWVLVQAIADVPVQH